MKYVEVIAESGSEPVVRTIAEKYKAEDFRLGLVGGDGMQPMRLVVADDKLQSVLDVLLPPAATCGLMLGHGSLGLASGAGLLLAVNVVCVNLASKIVFFVKGIHPRTWLEKEQAKCATVVYVIVWLITLLILVAVIYARSFR